MAGNQLTSKEKDSTTIVNQVDNIFENNHYYSYRILFCLLQVYYPIRANIFVEIMSFFPTIFVNLHKRRYIENKTELDLENVYAL